jgi:hypothetical protein
MAKRAGIVALLGFIFPAMPSTALAVAPDSGTGTTATGGFKLDNPIKYDSIDELIKASTTIIMRLLLILAVLYFIYAGFLYVTALDDEGKLESARKSLVNAAIGTAILVSLNLILELIKGTFRAVGVQGI